MNEITNVLNGETKEQILSIIDKQLPGAHAELFTRYVKNSENMKSYIEDLEGKIKGLNKDICSKDNYAKELKDRINELENLKNRKEDLDKREANVTSREMVLNHKEEINSLKLYYQNKQTDLAVDLFKTVFKPSTLRTEIQKNVGKIVDRGQYTQVDYNTNSNNILNSGSAVDMCSEEEIKTETED